MFKQELSLTLTDLFCFLLVEMMEDKQRSQIGRVMKVADSGPGLFPEWKREVEVGHGKELESQGTTDCSDRELDTRGVGKTNC